MIGGAGYNFVSKSFPLINCLFCFLPVCLLFACVWFVLTIKFGPEIKADKSETLHLIVMGEFSQLENHQRFGQIVLSKKQFFGCYSAGTN